VYNKFLTVIETPVFQRTAVEIWTPDERFAFIDWFACNPEVGKLIPGAGGLRKVRWARAVMLRQWKDAIDG